MEVFVRLLRGLCAERRLREEVCVGPSVSGWPVRFCSSVAPGAPVRIRDRPNILWDVQSMRLRVLFLLRRRSGGRRVKAIAIAIANAKAKAKAKAKCGGSSLCSE